MKIMTWLSIQGFTDFLPFKNFMHAYYGLKFKFVGRVYSNTRLIVSAHDLLHSGRVYISA